MTMTKHRTSSKPARRLRRRRSKRAPASRTTNTLGVGGTATSPMLMHLTLDQIVVEKGFNPRSDMGDISGLAESIATSGLLTSLVVRPTKSPGTFSIVAGERRYRAMVKLGFKGEIPCVVRNDLKDDHARARAVSAMENSEDLRLPLNAVDLGRLFVFLDKAGWSVKRIALETGHYADKVRRSLELMTTDVRIRKMVKSGQLSVGAGLAVAKCNTAEQERVMSQLRKGESMSESEVRRLRVQSSSQKAIEAAAEEAEAELNSHRKRPKRVPTGWRSAAEKQRSICALCHSLVEMQEEGVDQLDPVFLETRAMAICALWDRGDLDSLRPIPREDAETPREKKRLIKLWKRINAAAAFYEPGDEE